MAIPEVAKSKADEYDKWQAESDLRTITESRAIQKDPKRMACVRRAAKERLAEMQQIKKLADGAKK